MKAKKKEKKKLSEQPVPGLIAVVSARTSWDYPVFLIILKMAKNRFVALSVGNCPEDDNTEIAMGTFFAELLNFGHRQIASGKTLEALKKAVEKLNFKTDW